MEVQSKSSQLGHWLRERCKSEGLSLRQAGTKTGLSHGTIRDIMSGDAASAESIRKLAKGFGGDGIARLALEDKLLVLAGYRSERPDGHDLNEPLAELLDKLRQFNDRQLKVVGHFADFIAQVEKGHGQGPV